MEGILKIKELVSQLNKYSEAYYKYDKPLVSDKEYDAKYDELEQLEKETGVIYSDSPTQKVGGEILDSLNKVEHTRPMLSADKTKDINILKKFIANNKCIQSWKLDGLTIVIRYEKGVYKQAITRGLGGIVGEDVTHTVKHCANLPLQISKKVDLEVRGECVISWDDFNTLNEMLNNKYSHPRNLAAGSCRQLDSNIAKERSLKFIAFELIQDGFENAFDIDESLNYLSKLGFQVVEYISVNSTDVEEKLKSFVPETYQYPVDGLIYKINDYKYGESLGYTSKFPLNIFAFKWKDDTYETILRDVEWNTTRTGLINPIAVFDEVDLGGALTTRATLHNLSIIEKLELGIGDTITVYRANQVIPKIDDNLTRSNTLKIPTKCPFCSHQTEVVQENESKVLMCTNEDCSGKLLFKFVHFTSKNAMNIEGLSESTLKKFIENGWLKTFVDIYRLNEYKESIINLEGFGKRSYEKLWSAIEQSRNVKFENFLVALSIPQIGRTASKTISRQFNGDWFEFNDAGQRGFNFADLDDFGETMNKSIRDYFNNRINYYNCTTLLNYLNIEKQSSRDINVGGKIKGLTFVITGSVEHYKNRDELKVEIERLGGKVSGSVSVKTDYLINNDITSTSGKNKKANELGVKIISEDNFLNMIEKEHSL